MKTKALMGVRGIWAVNVTACGWRLVTKKRLSQKPISKIIVSFLKSW
jgi:hypothetical protein